MKSSAIPRARASATRPRLFSTQGPFITSETDQLTSSIHAQNKNTPDKAPIDWAGVTAAHLAGKSLTTIWLEHCQEAKRAGEPPMLYHNFARHRLRAQRRAEANPKAAPAPTRAPTEDGCVACGKISG
jgi:hypothetical protein